MPPRSAYKGYWKLKWKQWKSKTTPSVLTDAVCSVHLIWDISSLNNKTDWTLKPVKLEGHDEANQIKWLHMIYYFICFLLLLLFQME